MLALDWGLAINYTFISMKKHDMVLAFSLPVSAKLTLRLNTALVTFVTSPLPAANTLNERRRAWDT